MTGEKVEKKAEGEQVKKSSGKKTEVTTPKKSTAKAKASATKKAAVKKTVKKSTSSSKKRPPAKVKPTDKKKTAPKADIIKKAGGDKYKPNLLKRYQEVVIPLMIEKFGYKNALQVPQIEKISMNIGLGRAKDEPSSLEHALDDLTTISGQRAVVTNAKKAISNFKIRKGDPVGCRVTLRQWKMYEFLERLINIAIPRVRDFNGLSVKKFDGRGNFNFGLEEQIVFTEIDYDKIDKIRGLEINIVTSTDDDEIGYELLSTLGFPFRQTDRFKKKGIGKQLEEGS